MQISIKKNLSYKLIETAIFIIIWVGVFLIPITTNQLNGNLLWDELKVDWFNIASFLLVFIINIYLLIPFLLQKKQYERYILTIIVVVPLIVCLSMWSENWLTRNHSKGMPPMELGPGMPPMELSKKMPAPQGFKAQKSIAPSVELRFFQRFVIALLVIGTGTAYKVIFFWIDEEKQKKILQQSMQNNNLKIDDYIYVKADFKMVKILMSDIMYIESANEYIKIFLEKGEVITTFMRLKNIESKLPSDKFMRVQRSFIVNLEKIQAVEKNRIFIEHKKHIPIGEQYKENFQQYLGRNFIK